MAAPVDRLLDINGVAERCGVRARFIRRLVAERRIPYIKLGHLLRFDPRRSRPGWTASAPMSAADVDDTPLR
jgi:excisionase family DNA binding protein